MSLVKDKVVLVNAVLLSEIIALVILKNHDNYCIYWFTAEYSIQFADIIRKRTTLIRLELSSA